MAQPAVQTFGKYQILERIATGGMAEIYKARLEGIGGFQRIFAIKRILPHLSQNADYVAMLVDEAKVAGLLSHANIVQILDLGQVDAVWYIAMEFVHGRDLGAVLRRATERGLRLPVPHTVFVAIELLKGLEYAHQRQVMRGGRPVPLNIIHRDVSPPNVLLSFQGEVKLTDFGIARASLKVMETQAGVIKGRFDYMSPEQAMGAKDLDQRSDLFSVGVVLYEMLTGKHPFRADSELATLENVRIGKYKPISSINPDVPFTLETIVDRALRVDRQERYPSATAFKEALDKFFHDAGFIFTHSTLAQYVRGLFPELESGARTAAAPTASETNEEENRPTEVITDEVDASSTVEDPTHLMDRRLLDDELARQGSEGAGHFGLKPSEESTEVRRNPLLPRPAEWADEQETVIRKHLDLDDLADTGGAPTIVEPEDFGAMGEISTLLRRRPTPEPSVPRGPSRGPSMALVVAGVGSLLFAAGLFIGAVLGVGGGTMIARSGPAVSEGALLRVQAPDRYEVTVDGAAVDGQVALTAGTPHVVRVSGPGVGAFQQTLTLGEGELRVLVLTPAALERDGVAPP